MRREFDSAEPELFFEVARQRRLLSRDQAKTLCEQSLRRSVSPSQWAVESGMLQPVEAEIVEAFTSPKNLAPGYELLDVLGYGALGVVYRARQPHLQRDVAIKSILQSRLAQQNVVARFQQEGAAIGRLQHPNIVSAYDSGSHRGKLFLVMELVQGSDLRERLDSGPFDITTALWIVRQTASGLAHALAHQIIHRDIKPGNLILTEAPAGFDLPPAVPLVKIADFGLARFNRPADADQDTQLTLAGAALGTPMYCAPEQLAGDQADHRADIYALGATLFCMMTGQPPYDHEKVSKVIAAKVTGQPPRMELLPRELNPSARQLLVDMMRHDPDERISDYDTLIRRIDQSLALLAEDDESGRSSHDTLAPTDSNRSTDAATGRAIGRAVILATAVLLLLGLALLTLSKMFSDHAVPRMVPTGWEAHLFDGKSVTNWSDRNGLWHGGTDVEGGAILVGNGSAVRSLPDPPGQPGGTQGIGVRVGIDLHNATAAEVHFGLSRLDRDDSPRFVVRITREDVSFGRRESIDGQYHALDQPLDPPKNVSEDAPDYHEVRVELHGSHWFVYFDGELMGDADADPAADARTIQLVARDGPVHFGSPGVFGLTHSPDDPNSE